MDSDATYLLHSHADSNYVNQQQRNSNTFSFKRQYAAALSAGLSALATGSIMGWLNPILYNLLQSGYNHITLDNNEIGWVGSSVTIGAMFMCFPTGLSCDTFGRKRTLIMLALPIITGWLLIMCANELKMLYYGRVLSGLGIGASCVVTPLYISEIAHKKIRGRLSSYYQLMFVTGILWSYCWGAMLPTIPYYTIACALLPLIFIVCICFQPETPTFYMKTGKFEAAKKSLIELRGPQYDVSSELAELEVTVKDSRENVGAFMSALKNNALRKALFIAISLMFFQQFCGVNVVILYSTDILRQSGLEIDWNVHLVVVGLCQVFATFISGLTIDKNGRKPLLMLSALVMALSTASLGLYFALLDRHPNYIKELQLKYLPTLSLSSFIIAFNMGMGPIPWMISAEIFPDEVRGKASSFVGTTSWLLAFLITKFYLDVQVIIGLDLMFYMFSVVSVVGALFVHFLVPETNGKTMFEIQLELRGNFFLVV